MTNSLSATKQALANASHYYLQSVNRDYSKSVQENLKIRVEAYAADYEKEKELLNNKVSDYLKAQAFVTSLTN